MLRRRGGRGEVGGVGTAVRYAYLDEAVRSVALQMRLPDEFLIFTDNREAVKEVLLRHGVSADVFYEPGLPKPAVYALVGGVVRRLCASKVEVLEKVLERGPSFAVDRTLVKKYGDMLKRLKLLDDYAIFTFGIEVKGVLYLPYKLAYSRIGAGHSQFLWCNRLQNLICVWNKYLHDFAYLEEDPKCKTVKNLSISKYIVYLYNVRLLQGVIKCREYEYVRGTSFVGVAWDYKGASVRDH